ncbi:MAG TPA: GlxA family transcriptional regulator [Drouetiella sp.]
MAKKESLQSALIGILASENVQLLDVAGPLDVFSQANEELGRRFYQMRVIGTRPGVIRSSAGAKLVADYTIQDKSKESLDTILVAGSIDVLDRAVDDNLVSWLRNKTKRARRFGSVCSGAYLLAQAGLLTNRKVTTHWSIVERMRADFPDVTIDADAIHVNDGELRTSAGVTAGLDLALSLVEEDLGTDIAKEVANKLVMYFKRVGGQIQFSSAGRAELAGRSAIQDVQRWVAANPAENHTVDELAQRLGLSARHFSRLFKREVGITPADWVELTRIESAKRLLENGEEPKMVAAMTGFADVDTLRRPFIRLVGVSPSEYRKRHRV